MALARGQGEVGETLDTQLIPDSAEIMALEKLYFVRHAAGAELFVARVLQIPARGRLLDELADRLFLGSVGCVFNGAPDLQILGSITAFILARALPRAEKGATGRKGDLEDVYNGDGGQDLGTRSIDNGNGIRGGPSNIATAGGVNAVPQVPFWFGEAGQRGVDRLSVGDTNGLLGSVCKLQWIHVRHD